MDNENALQSSKEWWASHRITYNKGLIIAGILAFFAYAVVGSVLSIDDFEITIFTIFFQGMGYLIMMAIANLFYNLGYAVDKLFNKANNMQFRKRLFLFGYWFSFGLPFLIPIAIVICYLFGLYKS
jgi:hypothetical protein